MCFAYAFASLAMQNETHIANSFQAIIFHSRWTFCLDIAMQSNICGWGCIAGSTQKCAIIFVVPWNANPTSHINHAMLILPVCFFFRSVAHIVRCGLWIVWMLSTKWNWNEWNVDVEREDTSE